MDAPAAALCYDGRMRIDAHVKAFPESVRQRRDDYLGRDLTFRSMYASPEAKLGSLDDLLRSMDRNGIDRACLVSIGWSAHEHCVELNDFILEAAAAHPARIVPFCVVNPLAGREAAREVERCAGLGARGVGELHPDTQGFDLADRHALEPVMDAARAHGMPVLTHASEPVGHLYPGKGNQRPETLLAFAQNFPGATIVMAHWGGGLPFYALMPEVREALAGVYFDTAATPFLYNPRVFETVSGLVGAERILFGSDFPLLAQERVLKQLEAAGLSAEEKAAIGGGNAARLFGLQPAG